MSCLPPNAFFLLTMHPGLDLGRNRLRPRQLGARLLLPPDFTFGWKEPLGPEPAPSLLSSEE